MKKIKRKETENKANRKSFLKYIIGFISIIGVISLMVSSPVFAEEAKKKPKVEFFVQIEGNASLTIDAWCQGSVGTNKVFFDTGYKQGSLKKNFKNTLSPRELESHIQNFPNDKQVLKDIEKKYEPLNYEVFVKGDPIGWSDFSGDRFRFYEIVWSKAEKDNEGNVKVYGFITFKTLPGQPLQIEIMPYVCEQKEASCIEYDVMTQKVTAGTIKTKANRPHYDYGNNNEAVIQGFEDVWYTVLDENSFKEIRETIPQKLVESAKVIAKVTSARITELEPHLKSQFGRIDSQAYKEEYIDRRGAGQTLYVTPFIVEKLSNRYDISPDEYMWLALGDGNGNITKVYIIDRERGNISNLFENE